MVSLWWKQLLACAEGSILLLLWLRESWGLGKTGIHLASAQLCLVEQHPTPSSSPAPSVGHSGKGSRAALVGLGTISLLELIVLHLVVVQKLWI